MKNSSLGISPRLGRRRTPVADRVRWVRAWESSGLTQRDFAQAHDLSLGTLRNWIRRHGGSQSITPEPVAFQEIRLSEMLGAPTAASSTPWEAEIRLPSGVVLSVAREATASRVRELMEAVRC